MSDEEKKDTPVNSIENEKLKKYREYFADDIAAIENEIKKSEVYSAIIESEIKRFQSTQNGVPMKGGQHYLIEHVKNAVALQSQKQSLLKDKVALKKIVMDYSEKSANDESMDSIQKELVRYTQNLKRIENKVEVFTGTDSDNENLDNEIERRIKEENDD